MEPSPLLLLANLAVTLAFFYLFLDIVTFRRGDVRYLYLLIMLFAAHLFLALMNTAYIEPVGQVCDEDITETVVNNTTKIVNVTRRCDFVFEERPVPFFAYLSIPMAVLLGVAFLYYAYVILGRVRRMW